MLDCGFYFVRLMRNLKSLLAFAALLGCVSGCTLDDGGPLPQPPSAVLLYQSEFETNGVPDASGWSFYYDAVDWGNDTLVTPGCSGAIGLNLEADRLGLSYAETYLTQFTGPHEFILSFKAELYSGQNSVTATLAHIRAGAVQQEREFGLGTWNNCTDFSMTANMNLLPTDSVRIRFTADGSGYERSQVLIDAVQLLRD